MFFNRITIVLFLFLVFNSSCSNETSSKSDSNSQLSELEQFKIQQLEKAKNKENLVLNEGYIAELTFDYLDDVNENFITEKLMYFNIEVIKNEGFDESGPVNFYIGWKGEQIFSLTPGKDNSSIKNFYLNSAGVVDQYGAVVGLDYEHLIYLRPDLKLDFEVDGTPLLRTKESNIMYVMCCANEIKTEYSLEEMSKWKIQSIIRRSVLDMNEQL